jgi:cytochrome P450
MMHLTANIIHSTLLGSRGNLPVKEIGEMMNSVTDEIAVRIRRPFFIPDWVPIPGNLRYGKAIRKLDVFINGIIDEANSTDSDQENLLDMLLHAQDSEGNPLSRQQVRDEITTLFLAGHETTALALSWTWYLLSQHPGVEAKLLEELHTVLGGQSPTFETLRRLKYCEMIIQEAMRLYPPAYSMGREPIQPVEIAGYPIDPGSTILMSQWVVHHDPRFFTNPEAFEPERWTECFTKSLPTFAYFPFGGGRRLCIGKAFAMTEAVLLLATIAQRMQLSLVGDHPIALQTSITLRPKHGVKMVVRKR